MERPGFGRKTFKIETDANGKTVVHHVRGAYPTSHYKNRAFGKTCDEIRKRFDLSKNIYFVLPEFSSEGLGPGVAGVEIPFGSREGLVMTY